MLTVVLVIINLHGGMPSLVSMAGMDACQQAVSVLAAPTFADVRGFCIYTHTTQQGAQR